MHDVVQLDSASCLLCSDVGIILGMWCLWMLCHTLMTERHHPPCVLQVLADVILLLLQHHERAGSRGHQ